VGNPTKFLGVTKQGTENILTQKGETGNWLKLRVAKLVNVCSLRNVILVGVTNSRRISRL
jgi:hypothetical protein